MKSRAKTTRAVNLPKLAFTPDDLVQLARHIRGEHIDVDRLSPKLRDAFAFELGLKPMPGIPVCYAPIFRFLSRAANTRTVPAKIRTQISSLIFPRSAQTALGTSRQALTSPYSTNHFTFIYYETEPRAVREMHVPSPRDVPLWNSSQVVGTLTSTTIPDYVQVIAVLLEYSLQCYTAAGFRDPSQAGRLKVMVDFTLDLGPGELGYGGLDRATNQGWIYLRPDLTDKEIHDAPTHELFHNIEDMYHHVSHLPGESVDLNERSWSEGCAYIIADFVDPLLNRWMDLFNHYVRYTYFRPLTTITAAASFWRYASEKCTELDPAARSDYGLDVVRRCWEFAERAGELTLPSLRDAMDSVAPPNTRFFDFQFDPSGELRSNETLYGNFLVANITKDLADPVPDFRFDYLQDREAPGLEGMGVTELVILSTGTVGWTNYDLVEWSSDYYYYNLGAGVQSVRLDFSLNSGGDSLLQIVLCSTREGKILDIIRCRDAAFTRVFGVAAGRIDRIFAIVGSTYSALNYKLQATSVPAAPDLMITSWDGVPGCEYQQDPNVQPWSGGSPDIWVETANGDRDFVDTLVNGPMAKLFVRVRNKGEADTTNVQVKLFYAREGASSWSPVRNAPDSDPTAHDMVLTFAIVAANSETVGSVDWCLPPSPTKSPYHRIREVTSNYQLKAQIVSGDLSDDNNIACRTGILVHERVVVRRRPNKYTKPRKPRHPKWGARKPKQPKKRHSTGKRKRK